MKRIAKVLAATALLVLVADSASAQTKTWTTTPDFNLGNLNNVSDTKLANEVVLGPTPVSQTHTVWSDNFNYGLILRLDSVTGKQTARFDCVLNTINGVSTGVRPANEFCNWNNTGNCPGRAAVDINGDAWIVNRAFGNQGSISKFAGNLAHCIDRNNNGVIDTSNDKNGDGIIDMNLAHGEYFGQNDECILATIPVGPNNVWPRGLAIDKRGKIWVATYQDGKIYRYNPQAPVTLELTVNVGGNPFRLASGGDYVFVSDSSGQASRVHIQTGAVDHAPCPGNYGIVADPGGQVAWLGSWMNQATGMYRADFSVTPHTCTLVNTGPGPTTAMTLDNEPAPGPYVWGANYTQEMVSKWTTKGVYLGSYAAGGPGAASASAHGLSPDFQGNLWVVSEQASLGSQKELSKLNPATGALISSVFLGYLAADQALYPTSCSTGYCDGATPYLDGDYTGVLFDRQAPYTYVGSWDGTYDGGAPQIPWSKVVWNAEPQGAMPAETTLALAIRAADSLAALSTAAYVSAVNGTALVGVAGRFVQVKASLAGPGFVTSVLSDVTVAGPCVVLGQACCVQSSDCDDGNSCTTDTCPAPGGACAHSAVASCCQVDADCNDNNLCTADTCPVPGATCQNKATAGCCNSNVDCADTNACTVDVCSGPGGTCSHPTVAGCCNVNQDCMGASICVTSTCPTPGGTCATTLLVGCCTKDKDCMDSDPCTTDTCNTATGVCSNTATAGCCSADGQCNDNQPCTTDTCSGTGGVCIFTPTAGCCLSDADCNGTSLCTTSTCTGAGGMCVMSTVANCCSAAGDCDDGDPCTDDSCPTPGSACVHSTRASCCRTTAECDDGNRCTTDDCATPGLACSHTSLVGCCATAGDCGANSACVGGWCVSTTDAGAGIDGGVDAGSAQGVDSGVDAAVVVAIDAAAGLDATAGGPDAAGANNAGGCGCSTPGRDRPLDRGAAIAGLVLLAVLGMRRRRARRA